MTLAEAEHDPDRSCRSSSPSTSRAAAGRSCGTRPRATCASATSATARRRSTRSSPEYDGYSIREFLRERGFSEGAIELYGVMSFREAEHERRRGRAVARDRRPGLRGHAGDRRRHGPPAQRVLRELRRTASASARRSTRSTRTTDSVTVHFRTASGPVSRHRRLRDLHDAVLASCATSRHHAAFSRGKQRAIRELNYNAVDQDPASRCARRFWEKDDGIVGGATVTDLPIRRMDYPSHPTPTTTPRRAAGQLHVGPGRGALGRDGRARRGSSRRSRTSPRSTRRSARSSRSARPRLVRRPVRGRRLRAVRARPAERSSRPTSCAPEGRIHFAGEHCSLCHAWIQGALESGVRAAREIHEAPAPRP